MIRSERKIDDPVAADLLPLPQNPIDRGNHVVARSAAAFVEHLQCVDVGIGRDSDNTVAIVSGHDNAGHVRSVTEVVQRIVVVRDEVVSALVCALQLRRPVIDAGINDRDVN